MKKILSGKNYKIHFTEYIKYLIKQSMRDRRVRLASIIFAGLVVFTTTYALILPAITLEKDEVNQIAGVHLVGVDAELLSCRNKIHQHTDSCFEMVDGEKNSSFIGVTLLRITLLILVIYYPIIPAAQAATL